MPFSRSITSLSIFLTFFFFFQREMQKIYINCSVSYCLLISQITMHRLIKHRWFDMFNPNMSHLESKASFIYALPFPFHTVMSFFLCSLSLLSSHRKSGARRRPTESFQASTLSLFFFKLCLSSLAGEKEKRMREGLAHESKRLGIREQGRKMVKGHREGYTAASCHGYQRAAD